MYCTKMITGCMKDLWPHIITQSVSLRHVTSVCLDSKAPEDSEIMAVLASTCDSLNPSVPTVLYVFLL